MIIFLILGLVLGAVGVVFALQNVVPITVTFFAWQVEGSLALVLLLALLTGVIICALVSIPEVIRNHMRFNALKKQNKELESALADARAEKDRVVIHQTDIIPPLI